VAGDFTGDGRLDLVTVNAGSNNLTLISGFEGSDPVTTTINSGGVDPDAAFAFSSGGIEDLVVGNAGDGELALYEGGPEGLGLISVESEPGLPAPTDLAFSALTGGQVQFYAATAGRESAELVALSLGVEHATVTGPSGSSPLSVQLVALTENALPLVATVLTLTINVSSVEPEFGPAESEALAVGAFVPGPGISVGQPVLSSRGGGGLTADEPAPTDDSAAGAAGTAPPILAPWERFLLGVDEALEDLRRQNAPTVPGSHDAGASSDRDGSSPSSSLPAQQSPTGAWLVPDPRWGVGRSAGRTATIAGVEPVAIDAPIQMPRREKVQAHVPAARASSAIIPMTGTRFEVTSSPRNTGSDGASPSGGRDGAALFRSVPRSARDEPGPAAAPLLVCWLAAGWVRHRQWHRRTIGVGPNGRRVAESKSAEQIRAIS
jgi:hypothetical protein